MEAVARDRLVIHLHCWDHSRHWDWTWLVYREKVSGPHGHIIKRLGVVVSVTSQHDTSAIVMKEETAEEHVQSHQEWIVGFVSLRRRANLT